MLTGFGRDWFKIRHEISVEPMCGSGLSGDCGSGLRLKPEQRRKQSSHVRIQTLLQIFEDIRHLPLAYP